MNYEIYFKHISENTELLKHKEDIAQLFYVCFHRKLNFALWEWAYIKNPINNPLVNLALIDNQVVGHYAFIPIATTNFKILLSMTTMVHPSARKYNLFIDLAEKSYEFARQHSYDFIIGFPNKKSAIIHEHLLNWNLTQTFVAQCDFELLASNYSHIPDIKNFESSLDLENTDFINWRLKKPNIKYIYQNENIYKSFENNTDILSLRNKIPFLQKNDKVNFLTQSNIFKEFHIFDYPFAYKSLQSKTKLNFYAELLVSDIF